MADCNKCGKKAGLGRYECRDCAKQRAAEATQAQERAKEREEEKKDQRRAKKYAAWDEKRQTHVKLALQEIQRTLDSGQSPQFYRAARVGVEANIDGDTVGALDFFEYQKMGHAGWETVSCIPETVGVALQNVQDGIRHFSGGIGGNIVGATMVLRYTVTAETLNEKSDQVASILGDEFATKFPPPKRPKQIREKEQVENTEEGKEMPSGLPDWHSYNVVMVSAGQDWLKIVKPFQRLSGLKWIDANALIAGAGQYGQPVVLFTEIPPKKAEEIAATLESLGAVISLEASDPDEASS